MKSKSILGVIILFIIIMFIVSYFIFFIPTREIKKDPEAKIEIKKVTSREIVINQGESIYFSGLNSTDKDGKIESYHWDFDDGNTSDDVAPVYKYEQPGVYQVTLTVVDNDGKENITSIQITVLNDKPIAKLNIQNLPFTTNNKIPIFYSIQFNSTGSIDSDGNITSWQWDFGDGNSSKSPAPKYTYDRVGLFTVVLTVMDDDGDSASDSLDVEVIFRTYKVEWILEQTEIDIEPNGYTREGESTELTHAIEQEYISSVEGILNWTDRQPFMKNNQSPGDDLFEIKIVTPENISKSENSTTGLIKIPFIYIPQLETKTYLAETANQAITEAYEDAGFNNKGNGIWYYNVTALECKGGAWSNDIFDLDIGNVWSLKVVISYYRMEITDITI